MAKISLFDHYKNLTMNKTEWDSTDDEQTKGYSPYMMNRFVSMTDVWLPLANEANKHHSMPKEANYQFFLSAIPKRTQFFKYMKKKNEVSEEDRELLCTYYKCGPRQVDEYLTILTKEQVKEIVSLYKDAGRSKR